MSARKTTVKTTITTERTWKVYSIDNGELKELCEVSGTKPTTREIQKDYKVKNVSFVEVASTKEVYEMPLDDFLAMATKVEDATEVEESTEE